MVKNPPANKWVQSLVWEDPLKEGTATHSSILFWRISWTDEPICRAGLETQNRLVDTVGEGEAGMNGESCMETYTLPYVKQIASGNLL